MDNSISLSGTYFSGSSALIDIFHEHNSCTVIPNEFALFSYGQFFAEVLYPLQFGEIDEEIFNKNLGRFTSFNQSEIPILFSILRKISNFLRLYPEYFFKMRLGMSKILGEKYTDACRAFEEYCLDCNDLKTSFDPKYVSELISKILNEACLSKIEANNSSSSLVVFDQFISPAYIKQAKPFLPQTKFIVVDRNWRDQYADMRSEMDRMIRVNNKMDTRPFDEKISKKVFQRKDFFIDLRRKVEFLKISQKKSKNILWLDFENLVNDTNNTMDRVFNFLNIESRNWNKGNRFFPEKSIKNIGLWRESRYKDEIIMLEEYL